MILELSLIIMLTVLGSCLWFWSGRTQKLNRRLQDSLQINQDLAEELARQKEQLSTNLLTDPLTGLPSRKIFEDHLTLTVNQSLRHQLTFCVMFLDLQGFKIINDTLGYDIGDELLKEVAQRLNACIRQVDTLSRFNGDEFVFIFSQINKAETAAYITKRLLGAIAQPFAVQGHELYLAANIGIAVFPMDGNDGKTLLKNADLALSQAKLEGRNTYQFYQKEMDALSRRELLLSSSLHNETSYQQFSIYYQPRVSVETKKIVCMEAMLQWQHPDFGLIAVEEFSRLAEKNNNIIAIYEWLMRNACEDLMKWGEMGFYAQAISVQVSLKQLENAHFIQKVSSILRETKLDPANLIFEITESSILTKIDLVEKMLHMLKRLGVKIAINNFGANHLQLQHLRRLPIDIYKIDRSLVYDIDTNLESAAIVKMIIALATSLQSHVIAEGVETVSQKDLLLSLGCSVMQGGLFSAPVLAKDFNEKLLREIREGT